MAKCIALEAEIRKEFMKEKVNTLYLGGGTPSLLDNHDLNEILTAIRSCYEIADDAEVSLEANPDDISPARLKEWLKAGINRLSVGVQSFSDEELKWMNRGHDASRSLQCLKEIKSAGFHNFSADLIFGSRMSDRRSLLSNLEKLLDMQVPHISAYGLTVEPRTRLHKMVESGKTPAPEEEMQAESFLLLSQELQSAGYEHYEISNYALPGFRSRHNSSYWNGSAYLGLGPSAHSYDGFKMRSWNIADNRQYMEAISKKELPSQYEVLGEQEIFNERIMLGLRKMEGINLIELSNLFGEEIRKETESRAGTYISRGLLEHKGDRLMLTQSGKLQADGIAAALFDVGVIPERVQFGQRPAAD
jgi:oxygen-independent coproporphyrinogen-3 oxidase